MDEAEVVRLTRMAEAEWSRRYRLEIIGVREGKAAIILEVHHATFDEAVEEMFAWGAFRVDMRCYTPDGGVSAFTIAEDWRKSATFHLNKPARIVDCMVFYEGHYVPPSAMIARLLPDGSVRITTYRGGDRIRRLYRFIRQMEWIVTTLDENTVEHRTSTWKQMSPEPTE